MYTHISQWIRKHWAIVRFCLFFILYAAVIFLVLHIPVIQEVIFRFLSYWEAKGTSWFLNLCGIKTQTEGSIVFQPGGFAINITYHCTGILQMGFLFAGILAYRSTYVKKIWGILAGTVIILAVNYLRFISLFIIGVYVISWFEFFHRFVWELVNILTTFTIWFIWSRKEKDKKKSSPVTV